MKKRSLLAIVLWDITLLCGPLVIGLILVLKGWSWANFRVALLAMYGAELFLMLVSGWEPEVLRLRGKTYDTIQVKIEENFERYLGNQFAKKIRYNLKREVRLLEDSAPGEVVMKVCTAPDEVTHFLCAAERIARRTYQWKLGFNTARATPSAIRETAYLAKHGRWRSYLLLIRDVYERQLGMARSAGG